jgi:NADH dehydrogenase
MSLNLQGMTATVFGGTGFIGRYVVERLAKAGATVRVVTRRQQSAYFLRTCGIVGQIVPTPCAYGSADEIDRAVNGSDVVVNCVGILQEKRHSKFDHIHTTVPKWIAESCAMRGVSRFVHISALGAGVAQSHYAKSKLAGERAVQAAYPGATILRPSVVFGPEDRFFNMFAGLARFLPALPLIGGGKTRFQPVYVVNVADAIMEALTRTNTGKPGPKGKIYELGGPEILTLKEIYQRLFEQTGRRRKLISVPWGLASLDARILAAVLPDPPLTPDQVTSLKTDTIVSPDALTLADLGIDPTPLDTVLPTYLDRFRPGGRFAEKKRA